jgi:predicted outer membrane lipoprotein
MRYPLFAALLGVTVAAFVSILNAVFLAPEGYEDESGFRFGGMPSGPADVGVSAIAHS